MVRTYKRIVGKGGRATVDLDRLREALKAVTEDHMTLREAANKFKVNYVSIHRRLKFPDTQNKAGRTTALTHSTEIRICKRLIICAEWGYPLTMLELQQLISQFLADNNIEVPRFTNNIPGTDYLRGFLKRHRDTLTFRLCQNIKRKRAAVNAEIVTEYYDELAKSLKGVPVENIFNYDETNFSDNPSEQNVLCKRKVKYVERIMNNSKTAHSVMFCGNALGQMLPIYVVYKATNMYDSWMSGGPPQTRFNRTKNGWFDKVTFEDWIKTIVIPALRRLDGIKILIGDNLSSHLSLEVIRLCELHYIKFVFLPSNSTHLLQPLDVAVYAPLKHYWRTILTDWKKSSGMIATTVSKSVFPSLLTKLMDKATPTLKANVISGFRKCGIHPLNLTEMLSRLPKAPETPHQNGPNVEEALDNSFIAFMQSLQPTEQPAQQQKKKQKVAAGKSVSVEDLLNPKAMAELLEPQPSTSGTQQNWNQPKKRGRPKKQQEPAPQASRKSTRARTLRARNVNACLDSDSS